MIHYLRVALAEENASPELKTKGKAALKEAEQALIHYEKAITDYSSVAGHPHDKELEGSGEEHHPGSEKESPNNSKKEKRSKWWEEGSGLYSVEGK
jgi:hypothetical protein